MQQSIRYPQSETQTPTEPTATVSRLRTVSGNRFPRKCACASGFRIPSLATSRSFACSVTAQIRPTRSTERNPQRRVGTESS